MSRAADLSPLPAVGAASGTEPPLLTYYDDATGERAAVLLPPHWQTAAVLLGASSAGIAVSVRPWATAGLAWAGLGDDEPLEAVFVSRARLDSWLEAVPPAHHRFVLGLAAGGAPADDVPAGYRDYIAEVGAYPDVAPAYESIRPTDAASPDGTSYQEWAALAHDIAMRRGLGEGDRLLVDAAEHEQPVESLLAPLAAGASIVLCANLDTGALDARIAAEGVTRVL